MKLPQLSSEVGNFQVGFLPSEMMDKENVTKTVFPAAQQTPTPPPLFAQFVGVTLRSCNRRILFRRSLSTSSDVSAVLLCDLRVQQLLWNKDSEYNKLKMLPLIHCGSRRNETENKSKEAAERECRKISCSVPYAEETDEAGSENDSDDDYGDVISQEDGLDIGRTEVVAMAEARDEGTVPGRKRNDYRREIDLAHHILRMELEDGHNHEEDGYNGASKMAEGEHTTAATAVAAALFQHVPSTVRFNDALVCTSKDVQILKSGTIKMMRLTVICHSDLHYYQNHPFSTWRKHQQSQKYYRNTTTPTDETGPVGPFASSQTTPAATFSSPSLFATSSVQVTSKKEDGKQERKPNTITRQNMGSHKTNKEENENGERKEEHGHSSRMSKVSPSSSHNPSHHDSNQEETYSKEKSKECKTNWKRLRDKIRVIFQTYDIHVGQNTLVNLKCCPLASFQANMSPAVGFVYVEECEIMNNKKSDTLVDIGKVSGKTEIIITNVHHISYYERIVEMNKSLAREKKTVHLYGLDHAAKILKGMIKTSGGGRIEPVENPVVSYNATGASGASLAAFSGLLTEFSHGLLISGPSGCGKVAVVRETAKKLGAHLLSFNPSYGVEDSSAAPSRLCHQLTDIFTSALVSASSYQTVLLFPQIHLLFQQDTNVNLLSTSASASRNNTNRARILHHLCKLFDSIPDGFTLTVVGTTDKTYLVPLQLRVARRLEKEIIISPPKESERLTILQGFVRNTTSSFNMDLTQFASETPGYVAQDLLKVVRLALFKAQEEGENVGDVTEEHMRYAVRRVVPSVLEGVLGVVDIQRAISLDHIAGLHSVKLDLIKAIVWPLKHPEAFLRMGISPPKGILLYGPPGNCKTTLVRAVAATHQTNFLSVSAAELFSSGVGDSEKIVAHLFHRARMASPCILFIDELESIVGSRQNSGKKQTGTNESILSMLLTEMDGVGTTTRVQHGNENKISHNHKYDNNNQRSSSSSLQICSSPVVLVVAATNRPDLIDPALLRPGRFDRLVGVPPLDLAGRNELLKWCSKSVPFDTNLDFMQLAECTEHFSGADLVNLCREAALFALSDTMTAQVVTEQHFKMARSVVGPSLNPDMIRRFHEYGSNLKRQRSS